jgi:hypothetical protein
MELALVTGEGIHGPVPPEQEKFYCGTCNGRGKLYRQTLINHHTLGKSEPDVVFGELEPITCPTCKGGEA